MHRVAVAGHICVDLHPTMSSSAVLAPGRLIEIGPVTMSLGGPVGNTGRALSQMGLPVRLETSVGDDPLGDYVRAAVAAQPGSTVALEVVPGGSTSYSLILEPGGADRTIWHHVGVNATFDGSGVDVKGVDLFHLGYPPLLPALVADGGTPLETLLLRARHAGATTSVDLAVIDPAAPVAALDWAGILRRTLPVTDVISPSIDDLTSALHLDEPYSPELVDRLLAMLIDGGVAVAALSAGEHGLFLRTAGRDRLADAGRALADVAGAWSDRDLHVAPLTVGTAVTTNGAGDASTAGLLFAIAAGAGPDEAAALASAAAAVAIAGRPITPTEISGVAPQLAGLVRAPAN